MYGLELDFDSQLAMIERDLGSYITEFRPPLSGESTTGFYLDNPWYGPMDAHVLYAMIRRHKPRRVLELGSGFSTLIVAEALRANGESASHEVVDPTPSTLVADVEGLQVRQESAATANAALFDRLSSGDILFVDTSHTVKPGGEVVRVILEVLPTLAAGVIVHFHDFFRPFPYPRVLYERFNVHWQEQYLLEAFLAYNPNFRVICANHALWRLRRSKVLRLFPVLREGMQPSAVWLERLGTTET